MASLVEADMGSKPVDSQPENCRIVRLPAETLLDIIDHLKPCDNFLLSHTCKTLRKFTTQDWEEWRDGAEDFEAFEFYAGIAYLHADCWACATCAELHDVDYRDTPRLPVEDCAVQSRGLHAALGIGIDIDFLYNHVQLAVKYTRMQPSLTSRQRSYLRALMASRSQEVDWIEGMKLSYHAKPRVADDMFLLEEEYRFFKPAGNDEVTCFDPKVFKDPLGFSLAVCPHLTVKSQLSGTHMSRAEKSVLNEMMNCEFYNCYLETTLEASFDAPNFLNPAHSCPRCATDITIVPYKNRQGKLFALSIHVWSALGSDKSQDYNHWSMHSTYTASEDFILDQIPRPREDRGVYESEGVKRRWKDSGGVFQTLEMPPPDDDFTRRSHPKNWETADHCILGDDPFTPSEVEEMAARERILARILAELNPAESLESWL